MRTRITRSRRLPNGDRITQTFNRSEYDAMRGMETVFKMIFVWPFKLIYFCTIGWLVSLIKVIKGK